MRSRLRLLMGATALLYLGPVLAGLGGFGWSVVPVFTAIFLLWLIVLRPHQWPQVPSEWRQPAALITLGTQTAVQLVLVALLFGIGRAIGAVLILLPPFPVLLPISISFLSIPLSRLVWNPWKAAEVDQFLDEALLQIHNAPPSYRAGRIALADKLLAPLAALPDSTPIADISRQLDVIGMNSDEEAVRMALLERARLESPSRAELIALILHATDGRLIEMIADDGPTLALTALTLRPIPPDLIALYAQRLTAALDEDSELWGPCPSVNRLEDLLTGFVDTEAEAPLLALIDATNRAAPEDGLA